MISINIIAYQYQKKEQGAGCPYRRMRPAKMGVGADVDGARCLVCLFFEDSSLRLMGSCPPGAQGSCCVLWQRMHTSPAPLYAHAF